MNQKGFVQIPILIAIVVGLVVVGGGTILYYQKSVKNLPTVEEKTQSLSPTERTAEEKSQSQPAPGETKKEATPVTNQQSPAPSTVAACNPAPLQRQFSNTPYYTGQLFDAHMHMPQFFKIPNHPEAPVLDQDISKRDVACLFSKDRVKGVFAFYGIPSNLKTTALQSIKTIEQQYPGVISHFLEYVMFPGYPVVPSEIEKILSSNSGLFKGYGEISLYLDFYRVVQPDDPAMKELYKLAEKNHLMVYMHPVEGQEQAVEGLLRDNPNVQFVFHGAERLSSATMFYDTFLGKYPNAHYGVDIDLFGQDPSGRPLLDAFSNKQDFIAAFKQKWQGTLNTKVSFWKSKIEKHPGQFQWGTDRGSQRWQYDEDVNALLEEFARAFIGQLDPSVQAKYAYKNAESLLQNR